MKEVFIYKKNDQYLIDWGVYSSSIKEAAFWFSKKEVKNNFFDNGEPFNAKNIIKANITLTEV